MRRKRRRGWLWTGAVVMVWMWGLLGSRGAAEASEGYHKDRVHTLLRSLGRRPNRLRWKRVVGRLHKARSPKLVQTLEAFATNRKNHRTMRGYAMRALAALEASWTAPLLQRYRRSRSRTLRYHAQRALRRLCPRRVRRKWYYLHLAPIDVQAPHASYLRHAIALGLHDALRKLPRTALVWRRCGRPSRRTLRRRRMQGYQLNLRVQVSSQGRATQIKVRGMWTTFPGRAIRQTQTYQYDINAPASLYVYRSVLPQFLQGLNADIHRFFLHHSPRFKRALREQRRRARRLARQRAHRKARLALRQKRRKRHKSRRQKQSKRRKARRLKRSKRRRALRQKRSKRRKARRLKHSKRRRARRIRLQKRSKRRRARWLRKRKRRRARRRAHRRKRRRVRRRKSRKRRKPRKRRLRRKPRKRREAKPSLRSSFSSP